ncbi:MAG: ankyrin repeat domain-containing protein [Wolbachia endosymbiont of Armadillidium vulgare]
MINSFRSHSKQIREPFKDIGSFLPHKNSYISPEKGRDKENCAPSVSPSKFTHKTLEEKNYEELLKQEDIARIARLKYGWHGGGNILFEVIGSASHLEKQIQGYIKLKVKKPAIFIINKNANHWVTLVIKTEFTAYYADSLGYDIFSFQESAENVGFFKDSNYNNLQELLESKLSGIQTQSFCIEQQKDGYNCGIYALKNAEIIMDKNHELEKVLNYELSEQELKEIRIEFSCLLQKEKFAEQKPRIKEANNNDDYQSKPKQKYQPKPSVNSSVFYCNEFNEHDLGDNENPLRRKFNAIVKDLEENNSTSQGNIKLIKGDGNIEYFRAKLSDSDRLLFTSTKHNDKDAFVILEVILSHDYRKSKFLTNKEKIKNIKIISEEGSDSANTVEIGDVPQVSYLGKFITFNAKQEDIVERVGKFELPLVINGAAGSGKTSVALESLKKMEEKFKGGKILYITQSEYLIKESKKIFEYEYYDEDTREFKIDTPKEIEFLSIHEFFEKVAKKDVEGKKSINRNKFFSWFKKICEKGKFKKYKKDGDKIFEEFTAVIGGGSLLGEDGKDRYAKLGNRQSIFPIDKRNSVYDFFEEYRKFIEGDQKYYDPNLIAHKCTEAKEYDAVIIDEVQDLTESTLDLILKSLKDESKGNFLLCGDVNQVIHPSFFSLSRLKSSLSNKYEKNQKLKLCNLEKNYRNSKQVIELANRILHFKNYCFASEDKMTEKEKELFFMESDKENDGNVGFVAKDKEQEMAEKVSGSTNWAVLVLNDENKEDARKLFDTPLVFNIHEAKGLEFRNVILCEFTFHKAYNEIWNIACPDKDEGKIKNTIKEIRDLYNAKNAKTSRNKNKEDKSFEEYKFYINALYVGITRAIGSAYIMDDEKKCNLLKVIKPKKMVSVDIKKEESTPEEWRDMALKLTDEGNVEQAENIAVKLQLKEEKKYAQEITDALKAKKCRMGEVTDAVVQSPLDNDKSNSELKIDIKSSQNKALELMDEGNKKQTKNIAIKAQEKLSLDKNESRRTGGNVLKKDCHKAKTSSDKDIKGLFDAIERNNLRQVKNAISKVGSKAEDYVDVQNNKGLTPLHVAALKGCDDVAKFLLNFKARVDARVSDGFTPLHLAAQEGRDGVVELLLNHGADVNAESNDSTIPLQMAAQRGHKNVVEILLNHGADVDAKSNDSATPLLIAAQGGHGSIVKLLLKHGADVDAKSNDSATPLLAAAQGGYGSIVKLLLKHGAGVNAKSNEGLTPLSVAAQGGYDDIVKLLLDHEADVNAKNIQGLTPLHAAALKSCDNVAKLLLDHKADVNARGDDDFTPLHLAAQRGHGSIVKLLLKHGADVNAKSSQDLTPLSLTLNDCPEVANLLFADPNINVSCVKILSIKKKEDKEKFLQKLSQDNELFNLIKQAAEIDENKLDKLLKKIKELLESKTEYGFKPSLNYSPDGKDEDTTIKIAIKVGGKVLQLLHDYAEKNIDTDTEIFKKLKHAKENSQFKRDLCNVSVSNHSTLAQSF